MYKKAVSVLLTISIISSVLLSFGMIGTRTVYAAELLNDTFNSQVTYSAPSGWTLNVTNGSVTVEDVPGVSDKSVRVYDNDSSYGENAVKTFTAQTGEIIVEYDFMMPVKKAGMSTYLQSSTGTYAICIMADANYFQWHDGSAWNIIQSYNAGQWYHFRIIANPQTDTMSLYVDGERKLNNAAFRNVVDNIGKIMLVGSTGGSDVAAYWDNVKVYTPVYSQNFNNETQGNAPAGWILNVTNGSVTVEDVPGVSDKSVRVYDNDSSYGENAIKTFAAQTGEIIIEYDFMMPVKKAGMSTYLQSSTGTYAICIMADASYFQWYDGAAWNMIQSYNAGQWYYFKIIADPQADTMSLYIDGSLKLENVPFRNMVNDIGKIMLVGSAGGSDVAAYWDNIIVTENVKLESVTLSANSAVLERNDIDSLSITGTMSNGSSADLSGAAIQYFSACPEIAEVDSQGVVTAIKAGNAGVWAIVTLDGITIQSNVLEYTVQDLEISDMNTVLDFEANSVTEDQVFYVDLKVTGASDLYGFDTLISYDIGAFALNTVQLPSEFGTDGVNAKLYYSDKSGNVSTIGTLLGQSSGKEGDIILVRFNFRALEDKTGLTSLISLNEHSLSDLETGLYSSEGVYNDYLLNDGDVTGNGLAVNDLVMVAKAYGKSSGQQGYDVKLDMNSDGTINMTDVNSVGEILINRREGKSIDLVYNNFDNQVTQSTPYGWEISTGTGSVTIEEVPDSTDKSIKIFDNDSTASKTAERSFAKQTVPISVEFDFQMEQIKNSVLICYLKDSNDAYAVSISATSDGIGYVDGNNTWNLIQTYTGSRWYNFKIIADPGTDKMDLFIDNVLKLSDVGFRNQTSNISKIMIGGSESGYDVTAYWNNVRVSREPVRVIYHNDTTGIKSCESPYSYVMEPYEFDDISNDIDASVDEVADTGVEAYFVQPGTGRVPWWQSTMYSFDYHWDWWNSTYGEKKIEKDIFNVYMYEGGDILGRFEDSVHQNDMLMFPSIRLNDEHNLKYVNYSKVEDNRLKVYDNDNNYQESASKTFNAQTGNISVKFIFKMSAKKDGANVCSLLSSGGVPAVQIFADDTNFTWNDGSGNTIIQPYDAKRWYSFEILADPQTDKMSLYINNLLKVVDGNFVNTVDNIAQIKLGGSTSGYDVTAYWDDFLVTTPPPPTPSIYGDDFNSQTPGNVPTGWTLDITNGSVTIDAFYSQHPDQPSGVSHCITEFYEENPTYRIGTSSDRWDEIVENYAVNEVRQYRLDQIEEICENYNIDGLELDFMRHPSFFDLSETTEQQRASIMTSFVSNVRNILDSTSEPEQHRHLAIRIPSHTSVYGNLGINLPDMVAAGVDIVTLAHFYSTEQWNDVSAIRKMIPDTSINLEMNQNSQMGTVVASGYDAWTFRRTTPEQFYTTAYLAYARGVDGVTLFNFQYYRPHGADLEARGPWNEPLFNVIQYLGNKDWLSEQPQHYFIGDNFNIPVLGSEPLPKNISKGGTVEFNMDMVPPKGGWTEEGKLRIQCKDSIEGTDWKAVLNGYELIKSSDISEPYTNTMTALLGNETNTRAWIVPSALLKDGINNIKITMTDGSITPKLVFVDLAVE